MKLKNLVMVLAASAVLAGVVGCTNPAAETKGETKSTSPEAGSGIAKLTIAEPAEPKEAMPSEPAKKEYLIGVSLLKQDDDFYRALKQGLIDQAEKQHVKLDLQSADLDAAKQTSQVQNFITKKVDAIVLCPVDSQAIGTSVALANQAKIPVFTADIAAKSGDIVCHVASDNVEGGRLAGEHAAKLLSNKGNIGILDLFTVTSVQDRVKGFKAAIAKYPEMKIVDGGDIEVPGATKDKAVEKATNLLTAHPEIDLIFAINDNCALGAVIALQQVKNDKVKVIGFDASPPAQTAIATGTSQLKADPIQFPHLIGITTVDVIIRSLNGETVPATLPVPTGLVTPESFSK